MTGSLTVVGTGIQVGGQLTAEARTAIEQADEVLHLIGNAVADEWIRRLNPRARSLGGLYRPGPERAASYEAMVEEILRSVRAGRNVCAAFYGHPGVFASPSHTAVERARAEGYEARMLPGVSADACLFADLGVDPAQPGCQSYEATDFLLHARTVDTSASLLLWQIGSVGYSGYPARVLPEALALLVERLAPLYPAGHEGALYVAAEHPAFESQVEWVPLDRLADAEIPPLATLYVPPGRTAERDPTTLALLQRSLG